MTGLFSSGLLFIQQNIVGSCSPNMPQVYRGKLPKLLTYTQRFDQCGLLQVYRNGIQSINQSIKFYLCVTCVYTQPA